MFSYVLFSYAPTFPMTFPMIQESFPMPFPITFPIFQRSFLCSFARSNDFSYVPMLLPYAAPSVPRVDQCALLGDSRVRVRSTPRRHQSIGAETADPTVPTTPQHDARVTSQFASRGVDFPSPNEPRPTF